MSDANITKLLYAAETSFGVVPSPAATLQEIRFVSESLTHAKETVISEEIRADRARTSLIEVGKGAEGQINLELSLEQYNDFILAALMADAWTSGTAVAKTGTTNAVAQTITLTAGSFSAAEQAARLVKIAGFANSGNNGVFRVVSCTTDTMTLAPGSLTGADEVAAAFTMTYKYAQNGVTHKSFMFEKQFLGQTTPTYVAVNGCAINEMNLELEARARALLNFSVMGTKAQQGTATYGDGSPTAPSTKPILNCTGNVAGLVWDGAAMTAKVMSLSLTMNNNLRNRPVLASDVTLEHGKGTIDLTGTLNAYFEDNSLLADFINHADRSLAVFLKDTSSNGMVITIPQIQFPNGNPLIEGINSDVMVPLEFQATFDQAVGYMIQIDQVNA